MEYKFIYIYIRSRIKQNYFKTAAGYIDHIIRSQSKQNYVKTLICQGQKQETIEVEFQEPLLQNEKDKPTKTLFGFSICTWVVVVS